MNGQLRRSTDAFTYTGVYGERFYSADGWAWGKERRGWRLEAPVGSLSGRCACEHDGNKVLKPCNMHADWLRDRDEALNRRLIERIARLELKALHDARALDLCHKKNAELVAKVNELERKQFVSLI